MRILRFSIISLIILSALSSPWAQSENPPAQVSHEAAMLSAKDGEKNNELGYSVAIHGDVIVLGAPYVTNNKHQSQGAAYVFARKKGDASSRFVQVAKLTASDGATNHTFGTSAAIFGDTIVIGADSTNLGSSQYAGAAYIFIKPAAGWADMTETAKLTASDASAQAYFGSSACIAGDTVVIGADGADVGTRRFQGAAYVFVKPVTGWKSMTQTAKLTASDGAEKDQFGYSAAINADAIVIGARSATITGHARQGAVYVFQKPSSGWKDANETAKLGSPENVPAAQFGSSVAIDADTVVAGAPGANAAYLFKKPANGWTTSIPSAVKFSNKGSRPTSQFGYSVGIKKDLVAVGAKLEGDAPAEQGTVYVFSSHSGEWATDPALKFGASDASAEGWLGASTAMDDGLIVSGAPGAAIGKQIYRGKVYVFDAANASGK